MGEVAEIDYPQIESFLVGDCGLSPRASLEVSFQQLKQMREGRERDHRFSWEIARWRAWMEMMLSPNIKAERKATSPSSFVRFPWDAPEREVTAEDCHISEETEAWLNSVRKRYYENRNNNG